MLYVIICWIGFYPCIYCCHSNACTSIFEGEGTEGRDVLVAVEFKYQQPFASIKDYIFNYIVISCF